MFMTKKERRQMWAGRILFFIGANALCAAGVAFFFALLWIHNYC
jgi:hypothetical protein